MEPITIGLLGWADTAAILGVIIALAGFGLTALKLYFTTRNTPSEGGIAPKKEDKSEEDRRKLETYRAEILKHRQEILSIQGEMEKLKLEMDHLRESLGAKDDQILSQIGEMKGTIDRLMNMLIKLLTES